MASTFFGTNVKMHQTSRESVAYVDMLATLEPDPRLQFFAILPFTSLGAVVAPAHRAGIWIGAQNMHWAAEGEYTGEVSAAMLRDLDVDLVLLGHAERRQTFGETDPMIRRKIEAALEHGLRVLLCVGETADERRCGAGAESVVRQLKLSVHDLLGNGGIMIAYEPVWAIGTAGVAAGAAEIVEITAAIRTYCGTLPVLYGGSVTAGSAAEYAAVANIDGLFVGRAARPAAGFAAVARAAYPHLLYAHQAAAAGSPGEEEHVKVDE